MEQTTIDNFLQRDLEMALGALLKLTKALKFYPPDHPVLNDIAAATCLTFQPLLSGHEPRPFHVTRDGFKIDKTLLAPKNKRLQEFARHLVARRVRHLLFLPELRDHELVFFAQEISTPAVELLIGGGLPGRLTERGIRTIWINETSLDAVFSRLQSEPVLPGDNNGAAAEPASALPEIPSMPDSDELTARLCELLELLKEPLADEEYRQLLFEIQEKAPAFLRQTGIPGCLALFSLLLAQQRDNTRNNTQRRAAETTVDRLLRSEIRKLLIDAVGDQQFKDSQQRTLARVLIGLGTKIARQLLTRLFAERDAFIRRQHIGILSQMGEALLPLLEPPLHDPHWYVVRNAVHILGETRSEAALPLLTLALHHPEVRVRRALIRALTSIGTDNVIPLLVQLSRDSSDELRRPAVMALGGLGSPQALAPLLKQLNKLDLFGKHAELKAEIIHALAAIKAPQALSSLLKLAKKPNILRRKHIEILRTEAILAIGQLGDSQLIPDLNRLPNSRRGPVGRALQQTITRLEKQTHVS